VEDAIRTALGMRTWAVVGSSPDPARDSHRVAAMLERRGYRVFHVNPKRAGAYPALRDVPEQVDVVDIFRRADQAGGHVDEAIEIGARAVWMQLGVVDDDAAERARAAGLTVVMDRCPAIEMPRLGIEGYSGAAA
jgi:predicted CoA-binding protein